MKNNLILLCVVTTLVTSTTGCGCTRRFRDWLCRGSRCETAAAAPAPIAAVPYDPSCAYAYDAGCAYPGAQTYGYPPAYDSGWVAGGPGCESCSGGYTLPPAYSSQPGVVTGPATIVPTDPGPASGSGTR